MKGNFNHGFAFFKDFPVEILKNCLHRSFSFMIFQNIRKNHQRQTNISFFGPTLIKGILVFLKNLFNPNFFMSKSDPTHYDTADGSGRLPVRFFLCDYEQRSTLDRLKTKIYFYRFANLSEISNGKLITAKSYSLVLMKNRQK